MPFPFPHHRPGDIIHIAGIGEVTIEVPMGAPLPYDAPAPAPKPSDLTPTYQSALHGYKHGDSFEQGNGASNIMSGAVYVNDHGISGLELRYFGRQVITTGKAKGERLEFSFKGDEHISGVQGTYDESHLTSLTLLTSNHRHLKFGTAHSSNTTFSWDGSATQVVVGLGGFAGDMIHGLSVIYVDSKDDPPYDPKKDVSIESLSSRDIIAPKVQDLLRDRNYDELAKQMDSQTKNIVSLYGSITEIVDDDQNPWAVGVDDLGKTLFTHYDTSTMTAVYFYTDAPDKLDHSLPSDTRNVTIGTASGPEGWTTISTVNVVLSGSAGTAITTAILRGFTKFFTDWVLKKTSQFVGNALDTLAARLVESGVLKATSRVWAQWAGKIMGFTAKWGFRIFGSLIGALFGWGIEALLRWITKSYYLSFRIYNHDSDKVEWTPTKYYGYNETIPGADWQVKSIPIILDVGTTEWIPGVGKVTNKDWVGAYNSYIFENDKIAAGVAVAMAVQKGSGPDGLMCMYRIPKGPDNSMALTSGIQDPQTYLNGGHDTKVKHLSIDSPSKILMTSPALTGDPGDHYSCAIFLGVFPPTPK